MVDDQDFHHIPSGLQFEPELVLDQRENGGAVSRYQGAFHLVVIFSKLQGEIENPGNSRPVQHGTVHLAQTGKILRKLRHRRGPENEAPVLALHAGVAARLRFVKFRPAFCRNQGIHRQILPLAMNLETESIGEECPEHLPQPVYAGGFGSLRRDVVSFVVQPGWSGDLIVPDEIRPLDAGTQAGIPDGQGTRPAVDTLATAAFSGTAGFVGFDGCNFERGLLRTGGQRHRHQRQEQTGRPSSGWTTWKAGPQPGKAAPRGLHGEWTHCGSRLFPIQFSEGCSTWSRMMTGAGPFRDSSLSPSWSFNASRKVGPAGSGCKSVTAGCAAGRSGVHSRAKSKFPPSPVPSITGRSNSPTADN